MDNKESLSSEASFFRQQPVFKGLPSSFFGVPNLTRRLTDLLVGRIKAALPSIKWEVRPREERVGGGVCCVVPAAKRVWRVACTHTVGESDEELSINKTYRSSVSLALTFLFLRENAGL